MIAFAVDAHAVLDSAVLAAYGFSANKDLLAQSAAQRGSRPATDQHGGVALMLNRAKHGFCETKPNRGGTRPDRIRLNPTQSNRIKLQLLPVAACCD